MRHNTEDKIWPEKDVRTTYSFEDVILMDMTLTVFTEHAW